MTDTTRTTAKLATWGIVLTVSGLVAALVAAHQSVYFTTLAALGQTPVTFDEFGNATPVDNWAMPVAWLAGTLLVVGVWCLIAVVWRLAERADTGSGGHRPGAPLSKVTLALRESPEDVERYRAEDRRPSVD